MPEDQDGQESQPQQDVVVQSTTTLVTSPVPFTTMIVFPFSAPFSDDSLDEAPVADRTPIVGTFQPTTVAPRPLIGGTPGAAAVADPEPPSPLPAGVVSTSTAVPATTTTTTSSAATGGDGAGRGGEQAAARPDVDAADDAGGGSTLPWTAVVALACALLVGGPIVARRARRGPD